MDAPIFLFACVYSRQEMVERGVGRRRRRRRRERVLLRDCY